jgi:hypothetical protein
MMCFSHLVTFQSNEEEWKWLFVNACVQESNFHHNGIYKLLPRFDKCISLLGDYAEKQWCLSGINELHIVNDERYQLDATILFIIINNYMFWASICPSSGVQVVYYYIWCSSLGVVVEVLRNRCVVLCTVWVSLYPIQTYTQCTTLHTGSSGPQPQHLVMNTICSSIQAMYSWRWAYRCPKHVELFITNKIVASSWYLSSFSYMMHGHTYIKCIRCFRRRCIQDVFGAHLGFCLMHSWRLYSTRAQNSLPKDFLGTRQSLLSQFHFWSLT